ncbi:MAG: esterase family protein [Solobacterium sp.]|nr:esterase family protein [Solobacterium sp.]
MAIIESKFFSRELYRSVSVNVILPLPDSGDEFFESSTPLPGDGKKYQVLYLLHGFSADHTDWARFSRIETYAQAKRLAVVMPSGDNSFYANMAHSGNYYNYLVDELPMVMEKLYPISNRREDKFIAGLSMGGYGSLKAALREPDCYAAAASLSGGMKIGPELISGAGRPSGVPTATFLAEAYGPNFEYYDPEKENIFTILETQVNKGADLPKLFQCVGTEDFVYPQNIEFRDFALGLGVDLTYEEGPGVHNWDFWDPWIRRILDWLPLKKDLVKY